MEKVSRFSQAKQKEKTFLLKIIMFVRKQEKKPFQITSTIKNYWSDILKI